MENRDDAARLHRPGDVDRDNIGMSVRRAQDGGVQRARANAEIIDEASAPGEKRSILDARQSTDRPRVSRIQDGLRLSWRLAPSQTFLPRM